MSESAARIDRPRRTRLSADERRATILTAAAEVFAAVGYQRCTMAEVARRVGVSEPVIFQNFGSKAAVFAAVLDVGAERITATMRERAAANDSIATWIAELLASGHPSQAGAGGEHHVLFADAMSHSTEPLVKDAIRHAHRSLARTLAELLARGQAEGSIRRGIDPQAGAWWLISLMATRGLRNATMPDRRRLEAELGTMTLHVLAPRRLDESGRP